MEQVGACNPGSNDRTGELLGAVTDMEPGSDVGPQEDGSGSDDEEENEGLLREGNYEGEDDYSESDDSEDEFY